jgi:hypothetical protein
MSTSPAVDGDEQEQGEFAALPDQPDQPTKGETRLRLERSADILRGMVEQGGNPDDIKTALEQLRRIDRALVAFQ